MATKSQCCHLSEMTAEQPELTPPWFGAQTKREPDRFTTVAVSTELGQLRTFDWAKDESRIVACGLTTGRTTLLQLDPDKASQTQSHSISGEPMS